MYRSEYITKAQNWYHLPEEAVEVAKLLEPEEGRVMALVPADLIYYIRQYSTNINMPYGREMLIARWDYYNDMYEAMEEAEIIDSATVAVPTSPAKKVRGVSSSRDWELVSIDEAKVPVDVAGTVIRPVDSGAIMRLVRASKGTIKIPGVTYKETVRMSVRRS